MAAVIVGLIAIILGIVFKGMNVSFLVGWLLRSPPRQTCRPL